MYFQFLCLDFCCIQVENLWSWLTITPRPWLYNSFYTVKINSVSFVEFNQIYPTFCHIFVPPACKDHELRSKVRQNVFFLAEARLWCSIHHAVPLEASMFVPLEASMRGSAEESTILIKSGPFLKCWKNINLLEYGQVIYHDLEIPNT